MKIYIAGKVTGIDKDVCWFKFETAEKTIEALGHTPVNPLKVVGNPTMNWTSAMKHCIRALVDCDAIYFLPCWKDSPGARLESEIARKLKIKTITIKTIKNDLLPQTNTGHQRSS